METEEQLSKKIEQYQELAKEDKNIDVAALAMAAMADAQMQEQNDKGKKKAYWISVLLPPLGLFVAAYYLLAGKPDAKRVALICTIITVIMLLGSWLLLKSFISSIPAEQMNQLQGVDPKQLIKEYQDAYQ